MPTLNPPGYQRPDGLINAVNVTWDVLHTIFELGEPTLADIAAELEHSKSSIHEHLGTLVNNNVIVRHTPNNPVDRGTDRAQPRFSLALRFLTMGQAAVDRVVPRALLRTELARLAGRTGELAIFGVPEYGWIVVADAVAGHRSTGLEVTPGEGFAVRTIAHGKAVLSAYAESEIRSQTLVLDPTISGSKFEAFDLDAFVAELEAVRSRGYAVYEGETITSATGIAAPVLTTTRVIGAVGVYGPRSRLAGCDHRDRCVRSVCSAAESIEAHLSRAAE
jgi:DNA-binding IclR family transcriptional regulator